MSASGCGEASALYDAAGVALYRVTMNLEGKTANLTPGVTATLEFKTGERKLIEFVLSALMTQKAWRER